MKYLLVLCLLVPLLSGCWDQRPLEDRDTVLAIAVDQVSPEKARAQEDVTHSHNGSPVPSKPGIRLTAQIAVPGRLPLGATEGRSNTEQSPVWLVSIIAHTMESAFADLQQEISDKLFLGHLRVIIVSEQIARAGLAADLRDYLRREPQIRQTVRVAVSEGEAAKLMGTAPPLERVPALYLTAMLENATKLGKFPSMSLGRFWSYHSAHGREPFLPYVQVEKNRDIKIKGIAYFRGDKMVGVTDAREIDYYMRIMGVQFGGISFLRSLPGTDNGYYTFEVTDRRAIREVKIKNGRPEVSIRVFIEGDIGEIVGKPLTAKLMHQLEKLNETEGEKTATELIKKTQKQRSDIFAFGEQVRGHFPKYWNARVKNIENWREIYAEMPVDVEMKVKIRRIGALAD